MMTPLGVVRQEILNNTDRMPSDTQAVAATIHEFMAVLDDTAAPLAQRLINNLDPHVKGPLGADAAQVLEDMAADIEDPHLLRVQQWGALSLLGMVAVTYDPAFSHKNPTDVIEQNRSQVSAYVARGALQKLAYSRTLETDFRDTVAGLLLRTEASSEDAAIQLHDILTTLQQDVAENNTNNPEAEITDTETGSRIGEPYQGTLDTTSDEVQKKLDLIDWLHLEGIDFSSMTKRDVYHDSQKLATIIDLTGYHHLLQNLAAEVVNDTKQGHQFWPQFATAVTHYANTGRAKRVAKAKVQTFVMRNKAKSSENVVRAYYTPLGAEADGTRLIGLMAVCRTKQNQPKILRTITHSSGRNLSEA